MLICPRTPVFAGQTKLRLPNTVNYHILTLGEGTPSAHPGEVELLRRQSNMLEQILVAKVFNFGGICSGSGIASATDVIIIGADGAGRGEAFRRRGCGSAL
jgi:hypothetical protein